jgi:L-lactate dehydrogenase (cytochrome)
LGLRLTPSSVCDTSRGSLTPGFPIWVLSGGIRRGTDVLKALCLGATAVGLGRTFLFAQSAYGTDGVVKAVDLLRAEVELGMRLLGVTRIEDLGPQYVEVLPM